MENDMLSYIVGSGIKIHACYSLKLISLIVVRDQHFNIWVDNTEVVSIKILGEVRLLF